MCGEWVGVRGSIFCVKEGSMSVSMYVHKHAASDEASDMCCVILQVCFVNIVRIDVRELYTSMHCILLV